jgi:hypothetical protein
MRQVQVFVKRLLDAGTVYLGEFEGWWDAGQQEYHTETKAKELKYVSPVSGLPLERARQQNYFFRLSAFQQALEEHIGRRPEFIRPEARRNEVLGRLREGLQDVPITRTNFTWGIGMPGDPDHVIYVWIDALMNYITALGLGEPGGATHAARHRYWPATYHVMGKEILWFHAVVWPALLMALVHLRPQLLDPRRAEDVQVAGELHRPGGDGGIRGALRPGGLALLPGDAGAHRGPGRQLLPVPLPRGVHDGPGEHGGQLRQPRDRDGGEVLRRRGALR